MKTELIPAKSAKQARKLAPWAARIIKCDGGYMAFASVTACDTWRRQK